MKYKLLLPSLAVALLGSTTTTLYAASDQDKPAHGAIQNGDAVRYDKSAPLPQLISMTRANLSNLQDNLKPADHVYPNYTENPDRNSQGDQLSQSNNVQSSFGGISAPALGISFDGIGQSDAPGGGLPPDTNGDVGIDHYIQYINTDWAIYEKTTGNLVGNVEEGNTFWAGFGGPCETNNAGDPIVLFDKTANVWVFSQFISPNNADGSQCFAVSDRADMTDPNVTFNRYQFDFVGVFNDYPHIGIWTDENGDSSGYYFVTHDFGATFLGASFSVVERDAMIAGNAAEFVRFQNVIGAGGTAFGALPAHLESAELPAGETCAPFVHNRADLDSYLIWNLCVDWDTPNSSTLSNALVLSSSDSFGAGVNDVPQPSPAPAGSELDSFAGNTMYRVSARAYPAASGLPIDLVINHTADAGEGVAGVKWVNFSVNYPASVGSPVDNFTANIRDEGLYSPNDEYRWMGAISIDQSRNIGVGYSVSNDSTFPSVRYTGRTATDPAGMMRDENSCVVGTGVQTFVDGSGRTARWGDYSSMSIDPVDQCTFWLTVEYIAQTGTANWENRICSFTFPECGDPTFFLETEDDTNIEVCLTQGDPTLELDVFALGGFNTDVNLSGTNFPGSSGVSFSAASLNSFPASVTATFTDLDQAGSTAFSANITGNSTGPDLSRELILDFVVSADLPAVTSLSLPANQALGTSVRPMFSWTSANDSLSYNIEIATDAGFSNIIESATVEGTSYMLVGTLAAETEYFWRVSTTNNCGTTDATQISSFTTGTPGTCEFPLGSNTVYSDDLEGDVSDWSTPADPIGSGNTWAISGTRVNSGVAAFKAVDSPQVSDQYLVSPEITLPSDESPLTLSFWNFQNMEANNGTGQEACWDGAILEISSDGGNTFNQVEDFDLLTDPYNGGIVAGPNPLSALNAWCADDIVAASGDQEVTSVVNLDAFAGETVQFRFRLGSDGFVGDEGWYVDDINVQSCIDDLIFSNGFED